MRNLYTIITLTLLLGVLNLGAEKSLKRNDYELKSSLQTQSSHEDSGYLLSLETARSLALEHNKLIKQSGTRTEAATQTKKSLFTNYLPKLEVSANYLLRSESTNMTLEGGYLPTFNFDPATGELEPNLFINPQTNQPVYGDDGLPIFNQYALFPDKDLEILPKTGFAAGLILKQPIFTGGKITSAYKMGSLAEKASGLNLEYTKENILFETEETYWQVVSLVQKTEVTKVYLELVESVLTKIQDSFAVGIVNRNQLLQAQVKYNEVALLNQEAHNGLNLAKMALAQKIGLPLQTDIVTADTLVNPMKNKGTDEFSPTDYLERLDFQMLQIKSEVASQNINLERSEFLPQVGILASYNYFSYQLNNNNHDDFNLNAMAQFSLPIFQWGDSFRKVNSAKAKYKEENYLLENASEMMQLQISQAITEVENKQLKLQLAHSSLSQADEYLRLETDNYEVGMTTLTDLLNAQTQWQKAYSNYIDSQFELNTASNQLAKSCGKFN